MSLPNIPMKYAVANIFKFPILILPMQHAKANGTKIILLKHYTYKTDNDTF